MPWSKVFVGVRGMPERDIESLGVMGKGAGGGQEILPPPSPSPARPRARLGQVGFKASGASSATYWRHKAQMTIVSSDDYSKLR